MKNLNIHLQNGSGDNHAPRREVKREGTGPLLLENGRVYIHGKSKWKGQQKPRSKKKGEAGVTGGKKDPKRKKPGE